MAEIVRNLDLHEAMMLVMLEEKLKTGSSSMTTTAIANAVLEKRAYFQRAGGFAEASQIGARARRYPALFQAVIVSGTKHLALNDLPRKSP